jgi:hypothetical protein
MTRIRSRAGLFPVPALHMVGGQVLPANSQMYWLIVLLPAHSP